MEFLRARELKFVNTSRSSARLAIAYTSTAIRRRSRARIASISRTAGEQNIVNLAVNSLASNDQRHYVIQEIPAALIPTKSTPRYLPILQMFCACSAALPPRNLHDTLLSSGRWLGVLVCPVRPLLPARVFRNPKEQLQHARWHVTFDTPRSDAGIVKILLFVYVLRLFLWNRMSFTTCK